MSKMFTKAALSLAVAAASSAAFSADLVVEAENFNNTGGEYNGFDTYTINGVGAINYNQSGDWGDYQVEVPEAGRYKVSLFAGTTVNGTNAKIFISGTNQIIEAAVPATGSWDGFQEVVFEDEVDLLAGTTFFQLSSFGSPNSWEWNADRIVFTPVASEDNQAPVLEDDIATVEANTCDAMEWDNSVVINNHGNDFDPDGDSLFYTAFTQPANGYISQQSLNGVVVYTPDVGFTGEDTYTYTLSDGQVEVTATTFVTVYPETNIAPLGHIDSATVKSGASVDIDVLANDTDENICDTLSVPAVVRAPANGTVVINEDDTVTYTPNVGFVGEDNFSYALTDGGPITTEGSVMVTVEPAEVVNQPPVLSPDFAEVEANLTDGPGWRNNVVINNHANDSDPDGDVLRYVSFAGAENGYISHQSDGRVVYTPNTGFVGTDTYTYTLTDGIHEVSALTTIRVYSPANNDAPIAQNDTAGTFQDEPVVVQVLLNDSDPNNDSVWIKSVEGAAGARNGSVSFTNSTVTYTPDAGFVGNDSFTYTITDGDKSATATVGVSVNPVVSQVTTIETEFFNFTGGEFDGFLTYSVGDTGAINYVQSGDWGEYATFLPQSGTYTVRLYAGTTVTGANARITFNGNQVITAPVPANGNWDQFDEVVFETTVNLSSGNQTILLFEAFGSPNTWEWNADRIELERN